MGFGHVVEIIPYNAVFGSVVAYGTTGNKTFKVTPSESVIAKMQKYIDAGYMLYGRILGGAGQYGTVFNYNIDNTALNNGETTFEITLNAVSYSNSTHTLSMLVNIAIMCEK